MVDEVLDHPLAQIATAVHERQVSPAELAAAARVRIEQRDPPIGAVVHLADEPRFGDPSGPLAGVPYLLKDLQADALGLPLTRGSRLFAGEPCRGDSALVSRLLAAGVTLLGRTSSPELGLNLATEPAAYGPTRNPWHLRRTPGGSSGGAAAAVAAGMVPIAHATDSGGSIRIPAAWCGLVGLKPSRGAVPAGPWRADDWQGLSHEHAIGRTVADVALHLGAVRGPRLGEWQGYPAMRSVPSSLVVGLVTEAPGHGTVDASWADAARAAAAAAESLGHRVVPMPAVEAARRVGPIFGALASAHVAALVGDRPVHRDGSALLEPATLEILRRGRAMSAVELVDTVAEMHRLAVELLAPFAEIDVLLTPTLAGPPPLVGELTTAQPAADLVAAIFVLSPFVGMSNVTGGPGLSLPWGLDAAGLPVGVHLAGPPGADDVLLALAAQLEAVAPSRPSGPELLH